MSCLNIIPLVANTFANTDPPKNTLIANFSVISVTPKSTVTGVTILSTNLVVCDVSEPVADVIVTCFKAGNFKRKLSLPT